MPTMIDKISALPSATAAALADLLAIVQGGVTKKIAISALGDTSSTADKLMLRDGSGRSQVENPSANKDIANKQWVATQIPVGSMEMWAGSSAPNSSWLICDGSAVSRTTYATLFGICGTTYGAGDGSTTFNLPDMREASPTGIGTRASGVTAHDAFTIGQFKDDQFQGFKFAITKSSSTPDAGDSRICTATGTTIDNGTTHVSTMISNGNGTPRTGTVTRGKRIGLNFIIKALEA